MKWFLKCIRNYVNFSGRARRREYWNFVLFSALLLIVAFILDWICFGQYYGFFYGLSGLFLFLPNLAVMARRLHDTGRSAKILIWYYVLGLVWTIALVISGLATVTGGAAASTGFLVLLIAGSVVFLVWSIFFLVWLCTAGTVGENKYGPDPKQNEEL